MRAPSFHKPHGKSDRTYADVLVERIRQLASDSADSNLIVLGMGGCIILDNFPGAVHIRVTASDKVREKSVSRRYHISDVQAREALMMGDRKHKRFVQTLFGKDIADSSIYDMIINTDRLSVDECVDSIAELLANTISGQGLRPETILRNSRSSDKDCVVQERYRRGIYADS